MSAAGDAEVGVGVGVPDADSGCGCGGRAEPGPLVCRCWCTSRAADCKAVGVSEPEGCCCGLWSCCTSAGCIPAAGGVAAAACEAEAADMAAVDVPVSGCKDGGLTEGVTGVAVAPSASVVVVVVVVVVFFVSAAVASAGCKAVAGVEGSSWPEGCCCCCSCCCCCVCCSCCASAEWISAAACETAGAASVGVTVAGCKEGAVTKVAVAATSVVRRAVSSAGRKAVAGAEACSGSEGGCCGCRCCSCCSCTSAGWIPAACEAVGAAAVGVPGAAAVTKTSDPDSGAVVTEADSKVGSCCGCWSSSASAVVDWFGGLLLCAQGWLIELVCSASASVAFVFASGETAGVGNNWFGSFGCCDCCCKFTLAASASAAAAASLAGDGGCVFATVPGTCRCWLWHCLCNCS